MPNVEPQRPGFRPVALPVAGPVLIVDDNPDIRRLLQRLVGALGFPVLIAPGGAQALAVCESELPLAILLDVGMPEIDGLEVCRRLRADPRTATIPVLMITGREDLQSRVAAFEAGADDYILKPFHPREVAARLRSHIELALLRAEVARLEGVLATTRLVLHEFNNPIQVLVGALDLLTEEGQQAGETLAMIQDATQRLRELSSRVVTIEEPAFHQTPSGTMLDLDASR